MSDQLCRNGCRTICEDFFECEKPIDKMKILKQSLALLEKIEKWEADVIENSNWQSGLPKVTQEQFDKWINLQGERTSILEEVRSQVGLFKTEAKASK